MPFLNGKWFFQLTGKIENLKIGILKEGFGLKKSEADVDKMVREAAEQLATIAGAVVEMIIAWMLIAIQRGGKQNEFSKHCLILET